MATLQLLSTCCKSPFPMRWARRPAAFWFLRGTVSHLCARRRLFGCSQGRRSRCGIPENPDHRGIVVGDPIGALARWRRGKALALAGDTAKAKTAYQDFLSLWKDADPDI